MRDATFFDFSAVPASVLLRSNQRCDEFESAWKSGERPQIEAFISELPVSDHPELVWEFIAVDWEYRQRQGESPTLEEYADRFAGVDRAWLERAAAANPPATFIQPSPRNLKAPTTIRPDKERISFGDYDLLEKIGQGGMGTIWRARHRHMDRIVAVKTLSADFLGQQESIERFRREIKAAAKLSHPNIVAAYDAGERDRVPYLVMEYVDGADLAKHVASHGPCSVEQTVNCIIQAALGLGYAHQQGVVHRDIKPSNLLLDDKGVVKVLDLGLARLRMALTAAPDASGDESTATTSKHIIGTPHFMPPEQATDARLADHRADIYSLGCTMFFLATGQYLFARGSNLETVLAHQQEPVASLRAALPNASQELDRIFQRMVAKNPADRHQSMAEVAADLERLAEKQKSSTSKIRFVIAGAVALCALVLCAAGLFIVRWIFPSAPPIAAEVFSAKEAKELQQAWARYLNTDVKTKNSIDMEMVLIPPGKFLMGTSEKDLQAYKKLQAQKLFNFPAERLLGELPQHRVYVTRPFRISATEVTIGQFSQFVKKTNYLTRAEKDGLGWGRTKNEWDFKPGFLFSWKQAGDLPIRGDFAVGNIAWDDAQQFCKWLSKKVGKTYRLPTEAEWEYTCRAGNDGKWCFGNDYEKRLSLYAWYASSADNDPHPVARKHPNAFGLYDMHGNLGEWCLDWYDVDYYKSLPSLSADPTGPVAEAKRVMRGGSFLAGWSGTRSAARYPTNPDTPDGGFRVVMEIE